MNKNRFPSDNSDSPLHRQWQADRRFRRRVPPHEAWRGCLGLAMLLDRPDDTEAYGDVALVRNEQLSWLALRDVPVDRLSRLPHRRYVNYANTTQARLRYGMPVIDFTQEDSRDAVDFGRRPLVLQQPESTSGSSVGVGPRPDVLDCREERVFSVLNQMSAAMTDVAFFAIDQRGRPLRRSWAAVRPAEGELVRLPAPSEWMPRPYLAFPLEQADQLYWSATRSRAREWCWECPNCHDVIEGANFRGCTRCAAEHLTTGDFVANCPRCGRRRTWLAQDARTSRVERQFSPVLRRAFCDAMADGLLIRALGPEVYLGPIGKADAPGFSVRSLHLNTLVPHRLRSEIDGHTRVVHLPAAAQILVESGERVDAGASWAQAIARPPRQWRNRDLAGRWGSLAQLCGGTLMLGHLQRIWFTSQLVRPITESSQVLVPAELMAMGVREASPVGLWWDTAPALALYDWQMQAAVFPPLRLHYSDRLAFAMPGEVVLNGSITDPRLSRPSGRSSEAALHSNLWDRRNPRNARQPIRDPAASDSAIRFSVRLAG